MYFYELEILLTMHVVSVHSTYSIHSPTMTVPGIAPLWQKKFPSSLGYSAF
jgi:hypothetical protein